jgi:hypothetical protein
MKKKYSRRLSDHYLFALVLIEIYTKTNRPKRPSVLRGMIE